jgi:hypothetical protein
VPLVLPLLVLPSCSQSLPDILFLIASTDSAIIAVLAAFMYVNIANVTVAMSSLGAKYTSAHGVRDIVDQCHPRNGAVLVRGTPALPAFPAISPASAPASVPASALAIPPTNAPDLPPACSRWHALCDQASI